MEMFFIEYIPVCAAIILAIFCILTFINNYCKKLRLTLTIEPSSEKYQGKEGIVSFKGANSRKRQIQITSGKILINDKELNFKNISTSSFPYTLDEGKACEIWIRLNELLNQIKEYGYGNKIILKGCLEDAEGKKYCKKAEYPLNEIIEFSNKQLNI